MITERQKELAEWFEKQIENWKGDRLHPDGSITSTNPYCLGPWLDADWCGEFLEIMEEYHRSKFMFKWHAGNNLETRFNDMASYFHNDGKLTGRLQSCVKKIIEQLPKESKEIIMGMK